MVCLLGAPGGQVFAAEDPTQEVTQGPDQQENTQQTDDDLAKAKEDAKAELDKVDVNLYEEPEKSTVTKAVEDGKQAIEAATTISQVDAAKKTALDTVATQKTAAQKAEEGTPVIKRVYHSYIAGMKSYKRSGKAYNLKKLLPKKIRKKYVVAQGAATDGKYVYQAFEKHNSHYCVILKYNAKTFKKVKISKPIKTYHANDMAYNPKTKRLYSINCDGRPKGITIINPKTLKIAGRKNITVPKKLAGAKAKDLKKIKAFVSIAYNKTRNQYIVRAAAFKVFLVLDEKFKPVEMVTLSKSLGSVPQTMECDDEHIYIPIYRSKKRNEIFVYDWEGKYQYKITLNSKFEIENFFKIGSVYRVTMYKAMWIKKGYKRETYSYRVSLKKNNYEDIEVIDETDKTDKTSETTATK